MAEKTTKPVEKNTKLRRISLPAMILSVLLALIFWFYVQDAEAPSYTRTFLSVGVQMQSIQGGLSVIDGGEATVDITLIGKRSDLNKLKSSDLEAYLDFSSVSAGGQYEMDVCVLSPEGAEVSSCFPQKITVRLDETVSVNVPVEVVLGTYETEGGAKLEATPAVETVAVRGPKTLVETIRTARVPTGNLATVTTGFERNLEYVLLDEGGKTVPMTYLSLPEKAIRVSFSLIKEKTVPLTAKSLYGYWNEDDVRYTLTPAVVTVKGEASVVDSLTEICAIVIDETEIDAATAHLSVPQDQIVLPEGVHFAGAIGEVSVDVTLPKSASKTLKINLSSPHVVVSAPEGNLTAKFDIDILTLKLRGRAAEIGKASADDFFLTIDLSPFATPGEREVPVQVVQTVSTEGKYYAVGTYTVKVTLS